MLNVLKMKAKSMNKRSCLNHLKTLSGAPGLPWAQTPPPSVKDPLLNLRVVVHTADSDMLVLCEDLRAGCYCAL